MTGSVDEKVYKKIFFRSDAFVTTCVGLFGADSGRFVQGIVDLSGNGYPGGDIVIWQFSASPYDVTHFEHDITSPITLMFLAFRETAMFPTLAAHLCYWLSASGCYSAAGVFAPSERKRRRTHTKAFTNGSQLPSARRAPRIRPV